MRRWVLFLWIGACVGPANQVYLPAHFGPPHQDTTGMANAAAVELGRELFYSQGFSADGNISCASCHIQALAFSDGKPTSPGAHGTPGQRNTPGLFNLLWKKHYLSEGGVNTVERQVIVPLLTDFEMDFPPERMEVVLAQHPRWVFLSERAYRRRPDWFVFTRSLGAFLKHFISDQSPYDRFLRGDSSALSAQALAGRKLFFSDRLKCSSCHEGPLLQGSAFADNGLADSVDYGRGFFTLDSADFYTFPIPSLRNVALTAPYMHNGSLSTLEAVLQHYAQGGKHTPRQDSRISGFDLQPMEVEQLLAFFNSLTDSNFISNLQFRAPVQQ